MIFEMLRWWYGTGWLQAAQRVGIWASRVERIFSLRMLARTLFAPWRRIISFGGNSFEARLRAALDNFISRCVGFVVRIIVLIGACITIVLAVALATVFVVLWPLLPIGFIYCIVRGITG